MKIKILISACPILFISLWLTVTAVSFGLADSAISLEAKESTQSVQACQPLPPSVGTIVNVSTVSELQNAVNNATSGDTILVADGVYNLDGVYLRVETPNVALRSASGDRDAVVLDGNYATTEIIQIVASDVTIADVTLREAYNHPIHVMSSDTSDTVNTRIYNVHIVDPGEQAIKINPAGENTYPDDGLIACSHIELTDAGRSHIRNDCYTGGIDAHQAEGWVIRDNLIEGFWCANGLSEHGIHLWRGCRDTLVERNVLNDNTRGIGFGLAASGDARTYPDNPCPDAGGGYVDHYGGIIRNNFVFVSQDELFASEYGFDCGICLWQACGAQAFHNTVVSTEAPFSSIEWRFDNTDVEIKNNLVSHNLRDRGGTSVLAGNLENNPLALFVDGANGDLHLRGTAAAAIDQAASLTEVTDDIDGDGRPTDAAPDTGADEYASIFTWNDNKPLIIDHTCTDVSKIPPYWLEQAKRLTIHYAHTSHGSQITSGILNLESLDSTTYSVAIRTSTTAGLPPEEDPPALRMYDGNPPETYISPGDYWDGTSGQDRTRAVADTGDYDFSMWSWCGQVSGATRAYIQSYLDALNQFESEYPGMRFIFMTGHLDGSGSSGNLHVRNEQIRESCIENNKVLFDFADIERYDPDGTDFLDLGADDNCDYSGGNWADQWCEAHPGSDLCDSCSCAHSKPLNCNQKAGAFWWMMARLAGWNPPGDELTVDFGENGLWHYDGSWRKLTSWDPEDNLTDWSGGLAVDFGDNGLWNNDGFSWRKLTSWDPENNLVGWSDGLAVDFGINGLWNNDGSSWRKLSSWDPEDCLVGWSDGLAVDFGSNGLWNNNGSSWRKLTSWDPEDNLTGWNGGLAVDFGGNGLWNNDGSTWRKLSSWDPEDNLTGWSCGLAVDFGGNGLWNNDGFSWSRLSNWDAESLAGWPGSLAADFGTNGLWSYNGSSWTKLTSWNPDIMTGFADGLVVDFGASGMWKYNGSSWSKLTSWNPENMEDVDLN